MIRVRCLFILFIVCITCGCGIHSYSPPLTYIPVIPNKGDLNIATSVGISGFNANLGYALGNHVGVAVAGHAGAANNDEDRDIGEISGYYSGNINETYNAGVIIGGGMGYENAKDRKVRQSISLGKTSDTQIVDADIKYNHFFAAPYFSHAFQNGRGSLSFALRFTIINYSTYNINYDFENAYDNIYIKDYYSYSLSNYIGYVIEPTLKWTIGGERLRFLSQIALPFSSLNHSKIREDKKRVDDPAAPSVQFGVTYKFPFGENGR